MAQVGDEIPHSGLDWIHQESFWLWETTRATPGVKRPGGHVAPASDEIGVSDPTNPLKSRYSLRRRASAETVLRWCPRADRLLAQPDRDVAMQQRPGGRQKAGVN